MRGGNRGVPLLAVRGAVGVLSSVGVSLIEVMVALTIGALVVLLAERLFAAVGDASRQLRAARTALDREANARRWLAATFLSLEAGPEAGSFEGHADHVVFASWGL